ncbi:MAG: hypothetical protein GWP08_16380 [Nitrospiraceae bacterium]|nr:hypothetical protein [Nitrospiraceae bacterium]
MNRPTGLVSLVLGWLVVVLLSPVLTSHAWGAEQPGAAGPASPQVRESESGNDILAALHQMTSSRTAALPLNAPAEDAAGEATPAAGEADEAASDDGLSLSFDLAFNSKYLWRGLVLTDDPVFVSSVTAEWKGFTVNVLGNLDLGDVNGNQGDFNEIDVTTDYSTDLVGPLSGSVGMVFYTFPNTDFASTTEFYAGLGLDVPLQPSVTAYFDVDAADGVYLTTDFGHSFELPKLSDTVTWSLDLGAGFGWGSGNYNEFYFGVSGSGWTDFHGSLGVPISIGDHITVTPAVSYYAVLDDDLRAATAEDDNVVFGVNIGISF